MRQHDGRRRQSAFQPRSLLALPGFAWTGLFFVGAAAPAARLLVRPDQHLHVPGRLGLDARQLPPARRPAVPRPDRPEPRPQPRARPCSACSSGSPSRSGSAGSRDARQTLALVAVMIPFWSSFVVRTYALVNLLGDERTARRPPQPAAPVERLAGDPVHADGDRDRHRLQLPAADDPAALRGARADRSVAAGRCLRPRRPGPSRVPACRAAARGAGDRRRLHPRRRAGDRRVHDPRDPRR